LPSSPRAPWTAADRLFNGFLGNENVASYRITVGRRIGVTSNGTCTTAPSSVCLGCR
jgi:hypothetical protein